MLRESPCHAIPWMSISDVLVVLVVVSFVGTALWMVKITMIGMDESMSRMKHFPLRSRQKEEGTNGTKASMNARAKKCICRVYISSSGIL